jgi:hypothetical protein
MRDEDLMSVNDRTRLLKGPAWERRGAAQRGVLWLLQGTASPQ